MGARGPLPQSADVLYLRGNPNHRKPRRTVKAKPGAPGAPTWLSTEAKAEWKRVVPELDELGILSTVDRAVLAAYCDAWAKFVLVSKALSDGRDLLAQDARSDRPSKNPLWQVYRDASTLLERLARAVGATPVARLRMTVPEAPDDDEGAGILD